MNLERIKMELLKQQICKCTHDRLKRNRTWRCEAEEHGQQRLRNYRNNRTMNHVREEWDVNWVIYLIISNGDRSFTKIYNRSKAIGMVAFNQ
jgi:uncharacterized protein YjaG (DUF416 family)